MSFATAKGDRYANVESIARTMSEGLTIDRHIPAFVSFAILLAIFR
ncbi:MAG: hypothetical protein HA491_01735 [Candidatus Verstraetearchaeota archaeon]|nr:hypothetical protein [Candidatus Verstraetearchaeota archaeon]